MNINEQYGIIHDPNNEENTKVPDKPILIGLLDGTIGEALTLRGAVALIVGSKYFDAEDGIDEWNLRIEAARRESMKAIGRDIYAIVYDQRIGEIKPNFAADPDEEDYEVNENDPPFKIHVETERGFLLSLARVGAIKLFEREGSSILSNWDDENQNCSNCIFSKNEGNSICQVYNFECNSELGKNCSSHVPKGALSYTGGNYNDVAASFDINELINKTLNSLSENND